MSLFASSQQHVFASWRSNDLRAVFDAALPAPGWAATAWSQIVVALIDLDDWRPWLVEAWSLLDEPERARVARRRVIADQDALTLAYALHRLLLGNAIGCDAVDVPLSRNSNGCPRLAEGALHTSLSHTDGCVALAVTACGAVGIDVELATRAATMPEIVQRVCHPVDAAALAGLVGCAWSEALLALWVRKEAYLKAAGIGLAREMNTFALPTGAVLPLSPLADEMSQVRMLDTAPQWIAAIAGLPGIAIDCVQLQPIGDHRHG